MYIIILPKNGVPVLLASLADYKEASSHVHQPHVANSRGLPLAASQQKLNKTDFSVLQLQELNAAKNSVSVKVDPSSVKTPDNTILANKLIAVLWDPKQKTQLSCAQIRSPHKLWDKCVKLQNL